MTSVAACIKAAMTAASLSPMLNHALCRVTVAYGTQIVDCCLQVVHASMHTTQLPGNACARASSSSSCAAASTATMTTIKQT